MSEIDLTDAIGKVNSALATGAFIKEGYLYAILLPSPLDTKGLADKSILIKFSLDGLVSAEKIEGDKLLLKDGQSHEIYLYGGIDESLNSLLEKLPL